MTPSEVVAALRDTSCNRCNRLRVNLLSALGDRNQLARKASRDDDQRRDWSRLLARAERDLDGNMRAAVAHLDEPHMAPATREPATAARPVVEDTRPECPRCGVRVALNARGRLRAHRGPSGTPCPRRLLALSIVAPPVVLPSTPKRAPRPPRSAVVPSRLDAGSTCEDCGRWLPGERIVCGRCSVHRDTG